MFFIFLMRIFQFLILNFVLSFILIFECLMMEFFKSYRNIYKMPFLTVSNKNSLEILIRFDSKIQARAELLFLRTYYPYNLEYKFQISIQTTNLNFQSSNTQKKHLSYFICYINELPFRL